MLECLSALTVAATATRRAVLGSCVLQLPLRRAVVVAKQASTLQLLSGGRFVLGLGVGSHPGEYEAAGVDFGARGRLLDQGIARLHEAWGSAGTAGPYRQEPPGAVPVWIGGSGPAALRRAATVADGWVPMFVQPDEYAEALRGLRRATVAAGRPEDGVTASVVVMVSLGRSRGAAERGGRWLSALYGIPPRAFARHLVAGTAAACAEQVARYHSAGAGHVVVMITDDHPVEQFAELAAELGPDIAGTGPTGRSRADLAEVPT
jgi:alkanesulfonate monooxygenase SsuD/methylene tetrahydromethanopterin reductase-like flavin-dependent oxidoreductase (luciferase family)